MSIYHLIIKIVLLFYFSRIKIDLNYRPLHMNAISFLGDASHLSYFYHNRSLSEICHKNIRSNYKGTFHVKVDCKKCSVVNGNLNLITTIIYI